jgi:predicted nuclease of predicted toxin-antitoxin system
VKIVADENVDRQIVDRLRSDGHDVCLSPSSILGSTTMRSSGRAESSAVLLTADKDFGELVFRQHSLHSGVMLIRLAGLEPEAKAQLVVAAFEKHADELNLGFAVLSKRTFRLRRRHP